MILIVSTLLYHFIDGILLRPKLFIGISAVSGKVSSASLTQVQLVAVETVLCEWQRTEFFFCQFHESLNFVWQDSFCLDVLLVERNILVVKVDRRGKRFVLNLQQMRLPLLQGGGKILVRVDEGKMARVPFAVGVRLDEDIRGELVSYFHCCKDFD